MHPGAPLSVNVCPNPSLWTVRSRRCTGSVNHTFWRHPCRQLTRFWMWMSICLYSPKGSPCGHPTSPQRETHGEAFWKVLNADANSQISERNRLSLKQFPTVSTRRSFPSYFPFRQIGIKVVQMTLLLSLLKKNCTFVSVPSNDHGNS